MNLKALLHRHQWESWHIVEEYAIESLPGYLFSREGDQPIRIGTGFRQRRRCIVCGLTQEKTSETKV